MTPADAPETGDGSTQTNLWQVAHPVLIHAPLMVPVGSAYRHFSRDRCSTGQGSVHKSSQPSGQKRLDSGSSDKVHMHASGRNNCGTPKRSDLGVGMSWQRRNSGMTLGSPGATDGRRWRRWRPRTPLIPTDQRALRIHTLLPHLRAYPAPIFGMAALHDIP